MVDETGIFTTYADNALKSPNFATAIGPVLGGALAESPGWRWIFWVLAISSGLCLLLVALFLPETSRFIVGNGSRKVSGIQKSLLSYLTKRTSEGTESAHPCEQHGVEAESSRTGFKIPNPLASLKLLLAKNTFLITLIYGVYYTNFSCLQASLAALALEAYHISQLKAGLIYLPFGIGSCVGAYCSGTYIPAPITSMAEILQCQDLILSGTIMNYDYRVTARKHGISIDTVAGDNLNFFPIEKARFKSIWYFIIIASGCTTGYGWALSAKAVSSSLPLTFPSIHTHILKLTSCFQHLAVPLTLQFFIGAAIAITFNLCGTLLVDGHPESPAAAQAANNIVRCSLAGVGLAVLEPLLHKMGVGWTFTLFGGISLACLGIAWVVWRFGGKWRGERRVEGREE